MEQNKEMVVASPQAVQAWSRDEIELIKNTVAKGATDNELKLFLMVAKRSGLDPFSKQVHFVKRKTWNAAKKTYDEVGTIQTGIDGYRAIAERTGTLAGIDDAAFDSEEGAHPNKATVTVYRFLSGQRVGFSASARWAEYAALDRDGNPAAMWKKMPYLMLAKCAEALALRKAFPNDLSGLYTSEEMQQADRPTLAGEGYDNSPVADDVEVISTGDDTGEEPPKASAPPRKEPTLGQKKALVQQLLDKQSAVELKTPKDYTEACYTITGLKLAEDNYDLIIRKITDIQYGILNEN
jgi:phage recombination protein Bet